MATYIKLAKRKRAECLKSGASKKRKKTKPSIEKDIEEQMMVILKPECGCNIYIQCLFSACMFRYTLGGCFILI